MEQEKSSAEQLLETVIPHAEEMLEEHGEFVPYGGAMKQDGEIVMISSENEDENLDFEEVVSMIRKLLKTSIKEFKATAVVYIVNFPHPESGENIDAVAVDLDDENGYSVVVLVPFGFVDGELQIGEIYEMEGENKIFS